VRPIHIAHLDEARPVLVLTRDLVILERTQITVAPLTSAARGLSVEIPVGQANGLGHDSVVNCDNIVTIPRRLSASESATCCQHRKQH
jgi:mRNA interferase MazF